MKHFRNRFYHFRETGPILRFVSKTNLTNSGSWEYGIVAKERQAKMRTLTVDIH